MSKSVTVCCNDEASGRKSRRMQLFSVDSDGTQGLDDDLIFSCRKVYHVLSLGIKSGVWSFRIWLNLYMGLKTLLNLGHQNARHRALQYFSHSVVYFPMKDPNQTIGSLMISEVFNSCLRWLMCLSEFDLHFFIVWLNSFSPLRSFAY